jgi:hypothetical protein
VQFYAPLNLLQLGLSGLMGIRAALSFGVACRPSVALSSQRLPALSVAAGAPSWCRDNSFASALTLMAGGLMLDLDRDLLENSLI